MSTTVRARIHPSASIHPTAEIDDSAEIGAHVIVGPRCIIGARTVLMPNSIVHSNTTLGEDNVVHPFAVLGGDPQDRAYNPETPGSLIVGDRNIVREGVTFSRGTGDEHPTRIGSGGYFMVNSHIGHNCIVGDNVVLANSAMLAGHARIGNSVIMSASSAVHQFTTVGEMVMFQGFAGVGMHVPPYVVLAHGVNIVVGLNRVGLQRNKSFTDQDRAEIKDCFRAVYRTRGARPILEVVAELNASRQWGAPARRFLDFIADALDQKPPRQRGLCGPRSRTRAE